MGLFLVSIHTCKIDDNNKYLNFHRVGILCADSSDEATGFAYRTIAEEKPQVDGWSNYQVSTKEITYEQLCDIMPFARKEE